MKKIAFKAPHNKGIILTVLLSLSAVTYTYAHPWFGNERTHVADQYANGNTCYHVDHVKTYFFGVLVNEEMQYTPFKCGPGNEEQDAPPEN